MTTLSSVIKANQIPAVAGAAISQNELLEIFSDGKVSPCAVSDYATVANAGTAILAATTSSVYTTNTPNANGTSFTNASGIAQDALGNIYELTRTRSSSGATGGGLGINKYNSLGALQESVVLLSSTPDYAYTSNIGILSNGNLFVTWSQNTSLTSYYAIITPQLAVVVPQTVLNSSATNSGYSSSCALSGGGFAAAYTNTSGIIQISTYNNAGAFQASATVTGSSSCQSGILQLSSGNIALVTEVGTTLSYTIYSSALAVVTATTATTVASGYPVIAVCGMSGYFAFASIGQSTSAPAGYAVVSNAGSLQGAGTITGSGSTNVGNPETGVSLFNDDTNFWMIVTNGSTAVPYSQITPLGVLTSYGSAPIFGMSVMDPGSKNIYTVTGGATTTCSVFSPSALQITSSETFSAGLSGSNIATDVAALGDATVFVGGDGTTYLTTSIWKAENTAIIGVASSASASGQTVEVITSSGYYQITQLKGSMTKSFNMNSTSGSNLIANKGVIAGVGISQLGIQ